MAATEPNLPGQPASFFERHWKWFVLGVLFLATFLNYLDRQTLSVAMEPIAKEFHLDNEARGHLLAAFIYVYAFCHLFIGFAIDRARNLRWFFAAMLLGWSLVTLSMGFARNYQDLYHLRQALGVFECINFPICMLITARIFPRGQRGLAAGIFTSGSVFATLIAPKLVIYLSTALHWRWSFFITGALGVAWLIPWLLVFRHPERRSAGWAAAVAERDARHAARVSEPRGTFRQELSSWFSAFRHAIIGRPAFWAAAAAGIGLIPCWYFATQWLPSYFTQAWHVPYDQALGNRLVLVYLAQDLGLWVGGGVVLWLVSAGRDVIGARRLVIFVSFALAMTIMFVPQVASINLAIVLLCTFVFALGCWNSNNSAFKQEVNVSRAGTVAALVGFIETGFAAFVVDKVGSMVKQSGNFHLVFIGLAGLLIFGLLIAVIFYRERFFPVAAAGPPSAG